MGALITDAPVPDAADYDKAKQDLAEIGEPVAEAQPTKEELAAHVESAIARRIRAEVESWTGVDSGDHAAVASALMTAARERISADDYKIGGLSGADVTITLADDSKADLSGLEQAAAVFADGSAYTIRSANVDVVTFQFGGVESGVAAPPVKVGDMFVVCSADVKPPRYSQITARIPFAPNVITEQDVSEALKG
jgi:hypothetical protein